MIFLTKDEHKVERRTVFNTVIYMPLAKLATAEGIKLRNLSVWVWRLNGLYARRI